MVRHAIAGDPEAVRELFGLLRPIVFGYCRNRIDEPDTSGADECTQEVMCAVLDALPGYDFRLDKFLPWVFGIAAHKVADLHRACHRRSELLAPLPAQVATATTV